MTNVLAGIYPLLFDGKGLAGDYIGAYPDLFAAGAAFSGVPYGCFAGSSNWNS
jgi:hypothetical protein